MTGTDGRRTVTASKDWASPPKVVVENQLFRFIASAPLDVEEASEILGAKRLGPHALYAHDRPRCTIMVDDHGRLIVHGLHRVEAARGVAREVLLLLDRSEEDLRMEPGPIASSFDLGRPIKLDVVSEALADAGVAHDEALGCLRLDDDRHDLEILLWDNGRAVVPRARHPNLVAMAAVHWRTIIEKCDGFVPVLVG